MVLSLHIQPYIIIYELYIDISYDEEKIIVVMLAERFPISFFIIVLRDITLFLLKFFFDYLSLLDLDDCRFAK